MAAAVGSLCGNSLGLFVSWIFCLIFLPIICLADNVDFIETIAFLNSQLVEPRLSVVVTVTFRDDPRLGDLLMRNGIRRVSVDDGKVDLVGEEEEYMLESFDGQSSLI